MIYHFDYQTIPNSVTRIGDCAFEGCVVLEEVYCLAEKVPYSEGAFGAPDFAESNHKNAILYVPAASLEDYKTTEPWSEFGEILPLPD